MTAAAAELVGGVIVSFPAASSPSGGGGGDKRAFVHGDEARVVVELGARTMVGEALGVGVGVASVNGRLVTLLDLDPATLADRPQPQFGVFCELDGGEAVILTGASVLATGRYPWFASVQRLASSDAPTSGSEGGVVFEGEPVEALRVSTLYHRVEMRVWESRALSTDAGPPRSRRGDSR